MAEEHTTDAAQTFVRRVAGGAGILVAGQFVGQAIGFAVLAAVTRRVSPDDLGAYQVPVQIVIYLGILTTLGLPTLGSRELAQGAEPRAVISATVAYRLTTSVVVCAFVALSAHWWGLGSASAALLPIVALMLCTDALNLDWVLQGVERSKSVAAARLLGQVVFGIGAIVTLGHGPDGVRHYAWANVAGFLVTSVCTIWLVRSGRPGPSMWTGVSPRKIMERLVRSAPLAWALVMVQIYYSIDFFMLAAFHGDRDVGLYAIAYRIPQAGTMAVTAWVFALYPAMANIANVGRDDVARNAGLAATLSFLVAIPVLAVSLPVGSPLMRDLFGADFGPAGVPFVLLTACTVVIAVSVNVGNTLMALGDDRRFAWGVSIGAALNLVLNLGLIPSYGPSGAAVATLVAELAVLAYMLRRFARVVGPLDVRWRAVSRGSAAAAAACLASWSLSSAMTPIASCAVAGTLYLLVFWRSHWFGAFQVSTAV